MDYIAITQKRPRKTNPEARKHHVRTGVKITLRVLSMPFRSELVFSVRDADMHLCFYIL